MKALLDYLPIIIFFYFYKTTDPKDSHHPLLQLVGSAGNTDQNHILVATCALLISTLVVYGCLFFFQKFKLEKMQWFIVVMSVIFGGITLVFSDVTYIKMKAIIINIGIGIGFLVTPLFNKERTPIIKKLLGSLLELSHQGWMRLNLAWCGQFFCLPLYIFLWIRLYARQILGRIHGFRRYYRFYQLPCCYTIFLKKAF
jgi:intracellular septation protein